MIFHFVILSDEIDDFRREIVIDAEATFLELHDAILKTCSYKKDQMTSFFICDPDWSKKKEITLIEMNDDPTVESWSMDKTHLNDLLQEEKTKLLFLFDTMCERFLYIQLKTIETGKHLKQPQIPVSTGKAPIQIKNIDELLIDANGGEDAMYGDEDYDPDELDAEGFSDLEELSDESY